MVHNTRMMFSTDAKKPETTESEKKEEESTESTSGSDSEVELNAEDIK